MAGVLLLPGESEPQGDDTNREVRRSLLAVVFTPAFIKWIDMSVKYMQTLAEALELQYGHLHLTYPPGDTIGMLPQPPMGPYVLFEPDTEENDTALADLQQEQELWCSDAQFRKLRCQPQRNRVTHSASGIRVWVCDDEEVLPDLAIEFWFHGYLNHEYFEHCSKWVTPKQLEEFVHASAT